MTCYDFQQDLLSVWESTNVNYCMASLAALLNGVHLISSQLGYMNLFILLQIFSSRLVYLLSFTVYFAPRYTYLCSMEQ